MLLWPSHHSFDTASEWGIYFFGFGKGSAIGIKQFFGCRHAVLKGYLKQWWLVNQIYRENRSVNLVCFISFQEEMWSFQNTTLQRDLNYFTKSYNQSSYRSPTFENWTFRFSNSWGPPHQGCVKFIEASQDLFGEHHRKIQTRFWIDQLSYCCKLDK